MDKKALISVKGVYKDFKLPHEKSTGLKQHLINFLKRKRGYDIQHTLKGVTFDVMPGEFLGIVGRNGSGKSTLLKIIAGIYSPNKGSVSVEGSLTPFIELGVGFNPELTGRENVFLNGALLGFSRKEVEEMYQEIVDFAELEKSMDQKLKNYSSGMQVRLAFSIAIRAKSDILILDEVLAVGDQAFQKKCYEYFDNLKDEKRTVVLVTHDMSAVRRFCDRAILIEKGVIKAQGAPHEIAIDYQELFAEPILKPLRTKKRTDRWGVGGMTEKSTKVEISDDFIKVETTHLVQKDLVKPVIGFSVFNEDGVIVFEANTLTANISLGEVKAGQKVTILWELKNILKTGNYRVTVGSCNRSLTEFYDWNDKAATIKIIKAHETNGLVSPDVIAEVKI